ncbi:MAG: TlpA family protein disulfide reductase [Phycisphaerales bacterium JB043]
MLVILVGVLLTHSGTEAKEPPAPDREARILVEAREDRALLDALQGEPAPSVTGSVWLNTDARSIEDFRGKVVLVDFWGVWCAPCLKAVPKLKEWHERYADDGLVILGVHTRRGSEHVEGFVEEHGIEYPVVIDDGDATSGRYLVDAWPDVHLIDHEGVLRYADVFNQSSGNVENAIERLLEERRDAIGDT